MWDWILVYAVVFLFVFIFQYMVHFFDPKETKEKEHQSRDTQKTAK
ncbi:hypothetical protein UWK_02327 [Desulfocapsa sulfexigens DSM 10523]|uniref:Uncharacterized protein n=1 Tax=Desulfocapsa sulfexigens (strain DSM 10523 / SB164P1) TaxID=1167006 RepID=M1PB43_DESSD|nr:hypothetical protein UWK_02327 [Desulfocapsa sulfexigens DSM 10523]